MKSPEQAEGIAGAKAALRRRMRLLVERMAAAERAAHSQALCNRLAQQPVWATAGAVLFYAPMVQEPDVWPLLLQAVSDGKLVALPRYLPEQRDYAAAQVRHPERDVHVGCFGIREPTARCPEIPLPRFDLVLVPGLAFDARGYRLGRGRGYYDRLLAQVRGITCGVAFDRQVVDQVPVGDHDVRLHCLVTPTRWVAVAAGL